jgi:toxin ParE1/3/4
LAEVIWTDTAVADLDRIAAYLSQFNPSAAQRMARALLDATDALAELSDRGRPSADRTRELVVVWPYVIRYRVAGDTVFILRVRHGARRPD